MKFNTIPITHTQILFFSEYITELKKLGNKKEFASVIVPHPMKQRAYIMETPSESSMFFGIKITFRYDMHLQDYVLYKMEEM